MEIEIIISYVCYFVTFVSLNSIEYRTYKDILNPISVLSIPFTLIVTLCIICNHSFLFIPFNGLCLWIWTCGLILFWFAGLIVRTIRSSFNNIQDRYLIHSHIRTNGRQGFSAIWIFNVTVVLCIILCSIQFFKSSPNVSIGSKEMGEEMGTGGLVGRASNIILIAIPFYVRYRFPAFIRLIYVAVLMFFTVSLGTKTWLTYAIISSFIVLLQNHKINFRLIGLGFICLLLAFTLYYKLNTEISDYDHLVAFVSRHLYFYLTSGVLPMSEIVKSDLIFTDGGEVALPFIRLVKYWFGEEVSFHSHLWITTDMSLGTQSNVFTLFGTFVKDGMDTLIVYSLITGLVCYIVYNIYRKSKNIFATIAWGYTVAVLFFGWYNWGLSSLRIWEIYMYCAVFAWLCGLRFRKII